MISFARLPRVVFSIGVVALIASLAVPARAITYDLVPVGNAGNANHTSGFGAVAYDYQIGKYDVTIGQYTAFLNAVDPNGTNPNGIYNSSVATYASVSGISFTSGAAAGSKYSVIGPAGTAYGQSGANRPITYVSWFDAARFANWMTNGQGSGSTETGSYNLATSRPGVAPAKTPGAAFYIPTESEWYKAAYFSPNYGGVGVPGYYQYATQSNTAPGNVIGSSANQANYWGPTGSTRSVTQAGSVVNDQNYLTDVGAFSGSGSFYGTFDQSGNVWQWTDGDGTTGADRTQRGGCYVSGGPGGVSSSSSKFSWSQGKSEESPEIGFRLAAPVAVPEPSTCAMALAGLACGGYSLFRHRKRA